MKKTIFPEKITPVYVLAWLNFLAVMIFTLVFKIEFYNALPLLISSIVMFMQTNVNRYAFLLGSINSINYAVVLYFMRLYGSASTSLFFSFPLQIVTFINWNKHTVRGTTEIKCLSPKGRVWLFSAMTAIWLVLYLVFLSLGSSYLVLDNTVTVIGTVGTVLCLFRYSEYALLGLVSGAVNVVMYAVMTSDDITKIIWIIYSVYCMICSAEVFRKTRKGISC